MASPQIRGANHLPEQGLSFGKVERTKTQTDQTMKLAITKLNSPEHYGDWHDKPLRWQVSGPESELQKFSTKRDALLYRKIRRKAGSFTEATALFVNA